MAKQTNNASEVRRTLPLFEESHPNISRWISHEDGWIELGADHHSRSLARALYGGGMAWEGKRSYESLDEALRAMEEGIAAWLDETRPDKPSGGKVDPASPGSSRLRSDQKGSTKPRSRARRKGSKSTSTRPDSDKTTKNHDVNPPDRAVVLKVRKLADIAEALHRGEDFPITRLTTLKSLCKDPGPARSFALFLVGQARRVPHAENDSERDGELIERAETEMKSYLDKPTEGRKKRLFSLLGEIVKEQDEYKNISWGMVRVVHSRNLLVAEKALKSVLRADEAPFWLYQAARDYAERYDPCHGTGLIPSSTPMMAEIAEFWRDYFGVER